MGRTPTIQEAIDQLCRAIAASLQVAPVRIKVYARDDDKPILNLPLTPNVYFAAQPDAESLSEDAGHVPDRRYSQCTEDILDVLRSKAVPMATTRIMFEMSRGGKEWSQRYVEKLLAEMVRDGTLENPPDARPRGYRIPDAGTETED